MRPDLGEKPSTLLAIVEAPLAWSTTPELMQRTGLALESLAWELAELESAGFIARWETPLWQAWTLTPLGARRLGVRLVETILEEPGWIDAYEADPVPRQFKEPLEKRLMADSLMAPILAFERKPSSPKPVEPPADEVTLLGCKIRIKLRAS